MSVHVISEAWEYSQATGTRLLVLLAYADRARKEDAVAWPSMKTVAQMARCSPRQAQRHAHELVEMGELKVLHGGGDGQGDTTVYQVTVGRFARVTPVTPLRVTSRADKGDIQGQRRVSPMTPEPKDKPSENHSGLSAAADRLLSYWQETYHPTARAKQGRRRRIATRLRTFNEAQLRSVIDFICTDPWWRGKNDRSTDYTFPENFMKSDEQVDRHLNDMKAKRKAYDPYPVLVQEKPK